MKTANYNRVLLIEDDSGDSRLVTEMLEKAGNIRFELVRTHDLASGVSRISDETYDVILLDLSLPDSFGLCPIDQVLQNAPDLPLIVLSGAKDEQLALEAVSKGAQDYLVKGEIPGGVLIRAIAYAIERKQSEIKLNKTVKALKEANQKILEQQTSVIEEERLKVLLQMAGATSHELNQPLMSLLGSIELMRLDNTIPDTIGSHIQRIDESGRRIAEIVKKMSSIRQVEVKAHPGGEAIANVDQDIHLLYVEDSDQDFKQFQSHLERQRHVSLVRATSMARAMNLIKEEKFDVILADYVLPDGSGLELINWMENERLDTPIIAVTGHGDEVVATKLIKAGAYDYLPKADINQVTLGRCLNQVLEKHRLKQEVSKANAKLVQMATRDPLTGLHNRQSMNDGLEQEFNRAQRYGTDLACLQMDLDYFKEINDSFGHRFGDLVLQHFSKRLVQNLRDTDMCFRYGGEEFMVLLPNADLDEARQVAEKIRNICANDPYVDEENSVTVTISIGVASIRGQALTMAQDLLAIADKALYRAKAEGRNRVVVYHQDLLSAEKIKDFEYLQDRLATILNKTKKAAVESLALMVWGQEENQYKSHNQLVNQHLNLIGERLGFPPETIKTLQRAATFHDATKSLMGEIAQKTHLDAHEQADILDHPLKLRKLIEPLDLFAEERSVLLWHHENYDGSGYPDGLNGSEIPVGARILAIVDALVAMTTQRTYRRVLTGEEAIEELVTCAGTQFDPYLVGAMIDVIKKHQLYEVRDEILDQAKEKLVVEREA